MSTTVDPKFRSLLGRVGKIGLNLLFPKDFEYYMIALELVDSKGSTSEYLSFPVLPSELRVQKVEVTSIQKTSSGVISLINPFFVPFEISLSGNFGRKFKFLVGDKQFSFSGLGLLQESSSKLVEPLPFDPKFKTGFGCLKYLEKILEKSKTLDKYGQPHTLILYNPIEGNNYIVRPMRFSQDMSEGRNMLWQYSLSLKALGYLENFVTSKKMNLRRSTNMSIDIVEKGVNTSLTKVRRALR